MTNDPVAWECKEAILEETGHWLAARDLTEEQCQRIARRVISAYLKDADERLHRALNAARRKETR